MGRLIVVEGLDGAGKRTLADALTAGARRGRGARVARLGVPPLRRRRARRAGPRRALRPAAATWPASVHGDGAAVRAGPPRRRARAAGRAARARRACSSTATWPRTPPTARRGCTRTRRRRVRRAGCGTLEVERFGMPVPDHQLLLAVPRAVAAAAGRAPGAHRAGPGARRLRVRRRAAAAHRGGYAQLAAASWLRRGRLDGAAVDAGRARGAGSSGEPTARRTGGPTRGP